MNIKCSKKMYELSEEIDALTKEARVLKDNGENDKAKEKLAKIDKLEEEYNLEKKLFESENRFAKPSEPDTKSIAGTGSATPTEETDFIKAFRSRFVLTKGLMSEGSSANGGYTVPQDIQTRINEYKTNRFSFEPYVGVESVSTLSGSRTYRKRNLSAPFEEVSEGGAIPLISNPQYEVLSYRVKKYGGIIQVTDELFEDTAENISAEIAKHFALCREDTFNSKILAILQAKTETAIAGGIPSLRTAIIKTLGGAYSGTSKIYTNDDGYAYLCNLQDSNNRDYFFYDPSGSGQPAINIGGFIVPVVHVPNSVMASTAAASSKIKMPFIIGDLHEAVRIFDRRQMSIAASNSATISYTEGTGDDAVTHTVSAFQNGMTFLRAYLRADFKQVDADSWLNCSITA